MPFTNFLVFGNKENVDKSGLLDYNGTWIFMPCWKAGWEGGGE